MNTLEISTGKELKAFMIRESMPVIKEWMEIARGDRQSFSSSSGTAVTEIMKMVQDIVSKVGDLQAIEAKNCGDVLRLLRDKKITIEESKDLMSVLRSVSDIEDLKEMKIKLDQLTAK